MTNIDTSKEAVERLADELPETNWGAPRLYRAADTFRALLAERETLTAEVARLTAALRPFVVYVHDDFRRGNGKYALIACAGVGGGWIGAEDLRAAKQAFDAHAARQEGGV